MKIQMTDEQRKDRLKVQEIALAGLIRRGETEKIYNCILHRHIYKIKVENPWVPTHPRPEITKRLR